MKCLICGFENLDGSKYRSQCAAPLNIEAANVGQLIRAVVKQEIESKSKEATLVELDVTEKVANRLLNWAKITGAVSGVEQGD
jgi:hypothetical protein